MKDATWNHDTHGNPNRAKGIAKVAVPAVTVLIAAVAMYVFINGTLPFSVQDENGQDAQQTQVENDAGSAEDNGNGTERNGAGTSSSTTVTTNVSNGNGSQQQSANDESTDSLDYNEYTCTNGHCSLKVSQKQYLSDNTNRLNQDSDKQLGARAVSAVMNYTRQTFASGWGNGELLEANVPYAKEIGLDNDKNLLYRMTQPSYVKAMSQYDVSNTVTSCEATSVFTSDIDGQLIPTVNVVTTETGNNDSPLSGSPDWSAMNVYSRQYLVYLTPDETRYCAIVRLKSTITQADVYGTSINGAATNTSTANPNLTAGD